MRRLFVLMVLLMTSSALLLACQKSDSDTEKNLSFNKGSSCAPKGQVCARGEDPEPTPTAIPPSNAAPDEFVVDLTIAASADNPNVACPAGYERRDTDLNLDAGGDWIYLCLKFARLVNGQRPLSYISAVVTGSDISGGSNPCGLGTYLPINPGETSYWNNFDLNHEAGGKYIYLCYGNATSNNELVYYQGEPRRLKDVAIVAYDFAAQVPCLYLPGEAVVYNPEPGKIYHSWEMVGPDVGGMSYQRALDLNMEAGGQWVYACMRYD